MMRTVLALLLGLSALTFAQSVISAHSGVVQYVEGDVSIDNQPVHPKFAQFPEVKPNQVIVTDEGRVELLLTPGVFLRLSENSSVRMISNSLSDTRLAVVSGSALVEIGELLPNNAITFEAGRAQIVLPHKGLYRIDSDPARLRVYDGQARVSEDTAQTVVRKGHEVALDSPALTASTFDSKDTDAFYRWSARRSDYVASANLTSARVANNSMSSSGYVGGGSANGAWSWNPWFGMFTYLPGGNSMYMSPFGSAYYSPIAAAALYIPRSGPVFVGAPATAVRSVPSTASSMAGARTALARPAGMSGGGRSMGRR